MRSRFLHRFCSCSGIVGGMATAFALCSSVPASGQTTASGSAAVTEDFDGNNDYDHADQPGPDFKLLYEFYDNQDSIEHGNKDGFRSIEGVIPAGGIVQAVAPPNNITSVKINWKIHNDLGPPQCMFNVWIVWEFADDPAVAIAGGPASGNKFKLTTVTHAHQTHVAPGGGVGDGCYVPAEFVAAAIAVHQSVNGSTTFTCDIPVGAGTLGEWLLGRQGTTDDVLFNRAGSTGVSNWPQHIGQDIAGGPVLAPQSVGGDVNSDVSVFFEAGGQCPTVSAWGVAVMTLLVLTAGTVVVMRRRAAATT